MRLSINWLKDFVDLPVSPEELAERLTLAGFEVEGLEKVEPDFSGVVVARAARVDPHPNADRLTVVAVEDGRRTWQVVCGAPDVSAGRLYPFAPPGAVISKGRELKAVKIRGVLSEGMLLAEDELGISSDHTTLMAIPQDLPLGQDLAAALQFTDVVLEVSVTPNRPDCLSVLGLAREVAALFRLPLRHPQVDFPEGPESIEQFAKVTILAPVACPRYAARLITDLKVAPSPFWMRQRLKLAGLRPINNLVDVTNYVLLELGQPLHAFDFDRLAGGHIVVRFPHQGEDTFVTLDSQERRVDPETLFICDEAKPVALAGIMGGQDSEVTESTRRVLLESAYFNPPHIRRAAKRLGLSTESSYRFERGVDPDGVIRALERAAQLMAQLGEGRVLKGRLDVYPTPVPRPRLTLRVSRTNQVLGTNYPPDKVEDLLKALHLPVIVFDSDTLVVQVPSHRGDLTREIDLIEEVARLGGYEEIPVTLPKMVVAIPRPPVLVRLRREAKTLLLGLGFFEVVTYSFQSERLRSLTEGKEAAPPLYLANPLSEETALMRTSLLPGLLEALRRNTFRQNLNVRLFELAKTFIPVPGADLPREEQWLAGVMYGVRFQPSWHQPPEPLDFFDLKGVVESLLAGLKVPEVSFTGEGLPPYLRYGATVAAGGEVLGWLGELFPLVTERLDLQGPVFVFLLNFETLCRRAELFPLYTPLPRYPAVYRDVALVLPVSVPAARVAQAFRDYGAPWLEEASLFDVYSGPPIPAGKHSLAFHLTYRDPERTLTDEEVDRHQARMVERLARELGAQLR
jgi:phenylalanyl-tRNA synthetase beta chain|uniref:Phenylalanine--tRNA ligase beta subunit n=1 Tax=Desulfobacca acetoxidans TaxID=60893 RepID=A0A7C5AL75_9BACT